MGEGVVFPVIAKVVAAEQGDPGGAVETAGPVALLQFGRYSNIPMGNVCADKKELQGTQQGGESAVEGHIGEGTGGDPSGQSPDGAPQKGETEDLASRKVGRHEGAKPRGQA
jgi:hypothetical protein